MTSAPFVRIVWLRAFPLRDLLLPWALLGGMLAIYFVGAEERTSRQSCVTLIVIMTGYLGSASGGFAAALFPTACQQRHRFSKA